MIETVGEEPAQQDFQQAREYIDKVIHEQVQHGYPVATPSDIEQAVLEVAESTAKMRRLAVEREKLRVARRDGTEPADELSHEIFQAVG
jgi:hypothetical protein